MIFLFTLGFIVTMMAVLLVVFMLFGETKVVVKYNPPISSEFKTLEVFPRRVKYGRLPKGAYGQC